jgi:hypothetical protein
LRVPSTRSQSDSLGPHAVATMNHDPVLKALKTMIPGS